jgi:hypothetical protein
MTEPQRGALTADEARALDAVRRFADVVKASTAEVTPRTRGLRFPALPTGSLLAQLGGAVAALGGVYLAWGGAIALVVGGVGSVVVGALREAGKV